MSRKLINSEAEYKAYALATLKGVMYQTEAFDALGVSTQNWISKYNKDTGTVQPFISKAENIVLKPYWQNLEYPIFIVSRLDDSEMKNENGEYFLVFRQEIIELKEFNTGIMN